MSQPALDELIDKADLGMDSALERMRRLLPDESKESWELEREAFGIEDPAVFERMHQADDAAAAAEPVVDSPSRWSWRELFRKRWPDGPRKTRRARR